MKKKILMLAVGICLLCVIIFTAIIVKSTSEVRQYTEQMELGEKYLAELEYERAVAAYMAAIAIEPKSAEAYIGLAEAYLGMGETGKAIEVLEEGIRQTENEELKSMLDKIQQELAEAERKRIADEKAKLAEAEKETETEPETTTEEETVSEPETMETVTEQETEQETVPETSAILETTTMPVETMTEVQTETTVEETTTQKKELMDYLEEVEGQKLEIHAGEAYRILNIDSCKFIGENAGLQIFRPEDLNVYGQAYVYGSYEWVDTTKLYAEGIGMSNPVLAVDTGTVIVYNIKDEAVIEEWEYKHYIEEITVGAGQSVTFMRKSDLNKGTDVNICCCETSEDLKGKRILTYTNREYIFEYELTRFVGEINKNEIYTIEVERGYAVFEYLPDYMELIWN